MAEVAGLVLSGIPIAIWALEKYAEPFEIYWKYHIEISTFRADLALQKRQLQLTLFNVGLDQPSMDELKECFDTKFPDIARDLTVTVQRMDEITRELLKNLNIDIDGKPLWSDDPPDRVQWEWRRVKRSFGAKKREKLIGDLRHWNEDLRRCLEKPEVPVEDETPKVQELKHRFNPKRCNLIRECVKSLHRALLSGFDCTCSPPHEATLNLDWTACESDAPRVFHVALSYRSDLGPNQTASSWPQQLSSYMALSAKQRYGIAASVAWSVLHLSGSPWLGGRWDEDQAVILLERSSTGREILSHYPCVSYLFPASTNPASSEQTSRNGFAHLIPNKTVFALGILLIELCINKPFGGIKETRVSENNTSQTTVLNVYSTALGRLDEVRRQAGDSYGNAVERCVKCVFRGSEKSREFDLPNFRQEFYEVVVAPVQATYLMMPGSFISE
ncbi:hypothetical protein DL769_005330 [Monosporascus sp. CRB-8-3]|nr:hypothetical protein DL769_005330 [Monosporascus sp. CRB-8-3]